MSEYRDELAAAHARIAELEDQVRTLEDATSARFTAETNEALRALEADVARRREAADPARNAKKRARVSLFGAAFPLLGMTFSFLHLPILATAMSAAFVVLVLYNLALTRTLARDTRRLKEAEAKLHDAKRIAELESQLRKSRIATDADPPEEQMTTEAEAAARRA